VNEGVQRVNLPGMESIGATVATAAELKAETIDLPVTIGMVRANVAKER